ncbi:MAG: asparaginyl/glutamyl-tRNA amidotransferase subunit C [Coxiella sp. RIFCSPHIGHO2_12_FULL_42_15]|nr:MAG: asparaginyl/glutamyl-tRNA amidotransferase subunit C [Coxiella sp. RIFCSPHIGHO2_12_FULL_42_15]
MNLDSNIIKKIAHLSRLAIQDNEIAALHRDLNQILQLVEQMNKVDTKSVQPLAHPYDESQPLRADVITENNQRALFQRIAPQIESGLYIVPQVIDSE